LAMVVGMGVLRPDLNNSNYDGYKSNWILIFVS
jgi:hypothetical protein